MGIRRKINLQWNKYEISVSNFDMSKIFLSTIFLLFISFQSILAQNEDQSDFKPSIVVVKCVDCPEIISLQNPDYPNYVGFGPHKYNGTVTVMISIDEKGDVQSAKGISGHPVFRKMLEREALKAKFRPTTVDEKPIQFDAYIFYNVNSVAIRKSEDVKTITVGHLAPDTKPIFLPQPKYPAAGSLKMSGEVTVEILIDENGNIERATAVSGHPLLRASAVAAARQAIFPPQTLSGKPIKIQSVIVYKFDFDGASERNFDDEIILGKALKLPKPGFPSTFNGKIENNRNVLVEIEIDENGNVISAKAISGHPILRATSVSAARNSKFSQTTISGVPVKANALLTYEYILADDWIVNVIVNSIEAQKIIFTANSCAETK